MFSVVVAPIYILTNGAHGPLFSTSLPILLFPVFLVIAILTSLRCWFIVGLIYISLMVSVEKAMAPHSSTLAWKIPWMEEPGRLQSMGSQIVRHD